jgi:hypothetical protein
LMPTSRRPVEWEPDRSAAACRDCGQAFSILSRRRHHCRGCGARVAESVVPHLALMGILASTGGLFCAECSAYAAALPPEVGDAASSSLPEAASEHAERLCQSCYHQHSSLDFSRTYDVYGPPDGPPLVWLHDTGCSRMSHYPQVINFQNIGTHSTPQSEVSAHAPNLIRLLAQVIELSQSHRLLCIDLPAHGGRWAEELTLDSAVEVCYPPARRVSHNPVLAGLKGPMSGRAVGAESRAPWRRACAALRGWCWANPNRRWRIPAPPS